MKYAAEVIDGSVTRVIVLPDSADDAASHCASLGLTGQWVDAGAGAGIGWTWNAKHGLRPPQPYPSWTWVDGRWTAPVPYPDDGALYNWDESTQSWQPAEDDEA